MDYCSHPLGVDVGHVSSIPEHLHLPLRGLWQSNDFHNDSKYLNPHEQNEPSGTEVGLGGECGFFTPFLRVLTVFKNHGGDRMSAIYRAWMFAMAVLAFAAFAACGSSSKRGGTPPTAGSTWDEMNWDEGTWATTARVNQATSSV